MGLSRRLSKEARRYSFQNRSKLWIRLKPGQIENDFSGAQTTAGKTGSSTTTGAAGGSMAARILGELPVEVVAEVGALWQRDVRVHGDAAFAEYKPAAARAIEAGQAAGAVVKAQAVVA